MTFRKIYFYGRKWCLYGQGNAHENEMFSQVFVFRWFQWSSVTILFICLWCFGGLLLTWLYAQRWLLMVLKLYPVPGIKLESATCKASCNISHIQYHTNLYLMNDVAKPKLVVRSQICSGRFLAMWYLYLIVNNIRYVIV